MEDYTYEYDDRQPTPQKSLKGYKVIIIVLAVILVGMSLLYWNQMNTLRSEYAIERDALSGQITGLMEDYDNLRTENDTIAYNLTLERGRADSLLQSLAKERNLNRSKIAQYEKELGTLRDVMRNYVGQIDSLNTLNQTLITENRTIRHEITSERLAREKAEEKTQETQTLLRRGSVIRARDIKIVMLNRNSNPVTRARSAERLLVEFVLSANELAQPGPRAIYLRITGPDDYIMANSANDVFDHEGEMKTYSAVRQDVDYNNEDLPVGIYYSGGGIIAGEYSIEVYMDGYLIGTSKELLR